MITIVAIGKKHEDWIVSGLERYEKRLKQPFNVEWVLLPHSTFDGEKARQEESERILSRIAPNDYACLLDETGRMLDSPAFSEFLEKQFNGSKPVKVVIGGAYGVNVELKQRSDTVLSLSKLVFPHQLVRLLLIEQLYRAQEIARGSAYHHV